jgi:hypothetical protein
VTKHDFHATKKVGPWERGKCESLMEHLASTNIFGTCQETLVRGFGSSDLASTVGESDCCEVGRCHIGGLCYYVFAWSNISLKISVGF